MILPKTFIFVAVSCVSAVVSATNFASTAKLDQILNSGNGNFIIQLNKTTCIKHFVPRFMDSALDVYSHSFGRDKVEKRNHTRIVRRDTQTDQVHVFDALDFGSHFKAITVKFEQLDIVKDLLTSFDGEILNIIPDQDIKFDLPTKNKVEMKKRYYIRTSTNKPAPKRQGNYDHDSYQHDKNCPFAKADDSLSDVIDKLPNLKKRSTTTKKTTKKTTTKKKTTTTKKKTTTTKKATTTAVKALTCTTGSSGKKNGDGYNGYCCTSSDDCLDSCISGVCNGPTNTKTTTTKKATTTTKKSTTTTKKSTTTTKKSTTTTKISTTTKSAATSTCYPGSSGKKNGDGYNGYCCTSSDDCLDTCISGKCNGLVNTKTTTIKATTTKTPTTTIKTTTTTTKAATTTTSTSTSASSLYAKETSAPWNLARISEHKLDLSKPYVYDSNAGADAYIYVIDDGMNIAHVEFEGRATWGWSAYTGISQLGEGHGTHVAGIAGSKTYGVAKKVNLIAVQVLQANGVGSISSLLAGLQWALTNSAQYKGKAIINMSLGFETGGSTDYASFSSAIDGIVAAGVPIFSAAGNWGTDTCQVLPAGNKNVFAVAATDNTDAMDSYSGYGSCVTAFAPGTDIKSTYINSDTSVTSMTGTSMSTPHVAGIAALLLNSLGTPAPATLYSKITGLATSGVVKSIDPEKPTINLLVFNGQQLTTN